ncbi:hypothetical protein AWM68_17790 [Fictibacillus phosphorivorans]|uniref:Uncharacterized protein n=1 Tax=Fictibacillus phosphorivorans TaxID=1221500 RepID=A0A163S2U0_9BACL|nr:hypothetical protein [Fictibacillus phosphorivorans]KZE68022.1 hypothetical protein AWM68_17790 [Fictibacillus phosphorivorans]
MTTITATETNLFDYTDKKLKAHLQNNEEFNREVATHYEYYKDKLFRIVKEHDQEKAEKDLFQCVKSQVFNGYFIALEILNVEDSPITDAWLQQSEGMIAQQLPDLLKSATGESGLENVITHEPLKALTSWLVREYEDIYPTLMDISLNSACMGAKWAFVDEGQKRGFQTYQPQHRGIVGTIDDISFINPQNYLSCSILSEAGEVWDVIETKYNGYDRVAVTTVMKVFTEDQSTKYYVSVNVKSSLSAMNQQSIIDSIAVRIMTLNELNRGQLVISAASVEEFYDIG